MISPLFLARIPTGFNKPSFSFLISINRDRLASQTPGGKAPVWGDHCRCEEKAMRNFQGGIRALSAAEWEIFAVGLALLSDFAEGDISYKTDDCEVGIEVFDRLTPGQKIVLLADTLTAAKHQSARAPQRSAAGDAALMACLIQFRAMLEMETTDSTGSEDPIELRRMVLTALMDDQPTDEFDEPVLLPSPDNEDWDEWEFMTEEPRKNKLVK
jgi:hypothetical protein